MAILNQELNIIYYFITFSINYHINNAHTASYHCHALNWISISLTKYFLVYISENLSLLNVIIIALLRGTNISQRKRLRHRKKGKSLCLPMAVVYTRERLSHFHKKEIIDSLVAHCPPIHWWWKQQSS